MVALASLRLSLGDELVQAEIVDPACNRGGDAVQHERLEPTPFRPLSATTKSFISEAGQFPSRRPQTRNRETTPVVWNERMM
jgi:hypothetical protein